MLHFILWPVYLLNQAMDIFIYVRKCFKFEQYTHRNMKCIMGPNGNKVLHFYQSYCKYIAQIYTSKVYNVIYISGNTLDKRNTDFQEEEEPGRKKTIIFFPLSITTLSR